VTLKLPVPLESVMGVGVIPVPVILIVIGPVKADIVFPFASTAIMLIGPVAIPVAAVVERFVSQN